MAFNATSQVSYYYSPWQPSPGSVALPSSTTSHRNETPFRPSPHGLQAPTRLPPSLLSLSCSLLFLLLPRFFTDLWTRWFIHSVNRGPVGRFRLLFLGLQGGGGEKEREKEEEEGTCPRLGCGSRARGVLVGFRRNPPPQRWAPLFY